jgi:hypothetical protein
MAVMCESGAPRNPTGRFADRSDNPTIERKSWGHQVGTEPDERSNMDIEANTTASEPTIRHQDI